MIGAEFFIRQKYFSVEHDVHIATLTLKDISPETPCPCQPPPRPIYEPGEYVLVKQEERLQPYRFEGYDDERAWVRVMDRRMEVEGTGKINELMWTEKIARISLPKIVRRCRVVRVEQGMEVPRLADWRGSSDWFFYRTSKAETRAISTEKMTGNWESPGNDKERQISIEIPESSCPSTKAEGPPEPEPESSSTPQISHTMPTGPHILSSKIPLVPDYEWPEIPPDRKLRSLDLFCGGGNFGRGVADGGAVEHTWSYRL
jgi:DNA (cytosine-5)-methyltransferase 1